MYKLVLFILAALTYYASAGRTVGSHLSNADLDRLNKVFVDGLRTNDLQSIYYSVLNNKDIKSEEKQSLCKRIVSLHVDSKLNDFEKNFYLIGAYKKLACATQLPQNVLDYVSKAFAKDAATAQDIFFNLFSSKALGVSIDAPTIDKIAKNLQNILKKDDTLSSLGYAFYIAAELGKPAAFVYDRVEDAIVQADEVDGKMLQFEGGLSITALIINGAFKTTKAFGKSPPISEEQAVKFATYFLSRRSVQTAKGSHVLIEALQTLANEKVIAPICIQVLGNGQLQAESPRLSIAVVNLLGVALSPSLANVFGKVLNKNGNTVVAEKVIFSPKSSDKTVYTADLSSYRPGRGFYMVEVTADIYSQTLGFKVLGKVKVSALEIGIGESDSGSSFKKQSVSFQSTLPEVLKADHTQKIVLKFVLVEEDTSKVIAVHQSFVRFADKETEEEIIFIAEQDQTRTYKFDMDVGSSSGSFGYKSGLYKIELVVGDASISNSFQWHVANIELKFPSDGQKSEVGKENVRGPLSEIVHRFREPEKRPPRFLSDVFTGLCLTPIVVLLIFWAKLRVNVSNFIFSFSTICFHLGFAAILGLFVIFWLQLNMFETIRYLIPLATITFLFGNRLLRSIAAGRQKSG